MIVKVPLLCQCIQVVQVIHIMQAEEAKRASSEVFIIRDTSCKILLLMYFGRQCSYI